MTELKKIILATILVLVFTNFISASNSQSISIEVFHDHRGEHEFCEIRWNEKEYSSTIKDEFRVVDCENFLNNIQSSRGWTIEIENFFNDFDKFYSCEKSKWDNAEDLLNERNKIKIGDATNQYTLTRFCSQDQIPNPDTIAPVITNINTNPQMPFTNSGVDQKIKIYFDSDEYPVTIKFKLYDQEQNLVNSQGLTSVPSPNYLPVNYLISQLDEGKYYLYMTATDNSGNSKEYFVGSFEVKYPVHIDTTAPVITIISPKRTETSSTILFKINTDEQATAWFNIEDETTNITMDETTQNTFTYTLKNMKEGKYILNFYARDVAGNLRTEQAKLTIKFEDNENNCLNYLGNSNNNPTFEFNTLQLQEPSTNSQTISQSPINMNLDLDNQTNYSNFILYLIIAGIFLVLILILVVYLMRR